jgi:tetratricopeptide (TPR) repeat protein
MSGPPSRQPPIPPPIFGSGGTVGGAHVRDVSGGQVTQVAGDQYIQQTYYQLVGDLPRVAVGRPWSIPPPVRSFTGREDQLTALHAQLTGAGAATLVPTTALYGMGGVGKTQLALAYAHRYRSEYELGWWVPAETELGMLTALAGLAIALGLPADRSPVELAIEARDLLGARSKWLLIFDNASDAAAVAPCLPAAGGGHVLVTSRNWAWQGIADPFAVDLLPLPDAIRLLLIRSGDRNERAASLLAEELGRLPLALEQVAAYAAQYRMFLDRYLEVFRERRAELLARGRPLAYHGTVDAAFSLAVEQLAQINPAAVQLLRIGALLAPDELPISLLLSAPAQLPVQLAEAAGDLISQQELVGVLYQAGLITEDVADTARLHRLIQAVVLGHLSDSDRKKLVVQTVGLLAELFPDDGWEPRVWPRCALLLPHVQRLLDHAASMDLANHDLAHVLVSTASYVRSRALFTAARDLNRQVLEILQRLDVADDSIVAGVLNNLALNLHDLGEYEQAREANEQALTIRQRLYESDHPDVATSLNNLGNDVGQLGEMARARELHEQALAMRQRLYESNHPHIASGLRNLATDLHKLGEYERARELGEQALAMWQRLYEHDHPQVADSMRNLAFDFYELGAHERARELDEQALAMFQRLYEGDHPDVAASLSSLASDMRELGEQERARELDEQAQAMRQRLEQANQSG